MRDSAAASFRRPPVAANLSVRRVLRPMQELIAAAAAILLLVTAASLGTALHGFRKRRRAQLAHELEHGRQIVAEVPSGTEMTLFSEADETFSYGATTLDKGRITAARVLINGTPITAYESRQFQRSATAVSAAFEDRPEGIAHDRWDVAIETLDGTTMVACGAIRERISQELARRIFDRVKQYLVERDGATASG